MRLLSAVMILSLCANGICASPDDELQVNVLGGRDVAVSAPGGRAADIRIQVVDRQSKPVRGATVSAVLPSLGAGGHFRGGETIATKETGADGTVEFSGIHLRKVPGTFTTRILARKGFRTGSTEVTQNASTTAAEPAGGRFSRRTLVMMAVAGAGVAAGVVAATCCGSSGPTAPSLTVTPGAPATTGPR
jgi:hypothetical protein